MPVPDAFDVAVSSFSLAGLALQVANFCKSPELESLTRQWERVSEYLHCEVASVLETNKWTLGDDYQDFKKEYDQLQDSINKRERNARQLERSKLTTSQKNDERKRIERAHAKAKYFKERVIISSQDKRGNSDTMSFSESIVEPQPPSFFARVFSRPNSEASRDVESLASHSRSENSVNGSTASSSLSQPSSTSSSGYATPQDFKDEAQSLGFPDTNISIRPTESGFEFNLTNGNDIAQVFTGEEILRNASLLPKSTMIPIIEFSHKLASMFPLGGGVTSPVPVAGETSNVSHQCESS